MSIKPNCKKCYFSKAYYQSDGLAACDSEEIAEPMVIKHDKYREKDQQCVVRLRWGEECNCEQFVPRLSEATGDYELEEEISYNASFKCPFCGDEMYVYDIPVCGNKLVRCDNCGKRMCVYGGDY